MSKKNLYSGGGFAEREYRCFGCGEVGHLKRDCPKREKEKPRESQVLPVGIDAWSCQRQVLGLVCQKLVE